MGITQTKRSLHGLLLLCISFAQVVWAEEGLDRDVLTAVKNATVFLRVKTAAGESQGSGFMLAPDMIVTNAHVVGMKAKYPLEPEWIKIVFHSGIPGEELVLNGKVLSHDYFADLAYIRIVEADSRTLPKPLMLADEKQIRETMPIYIWGFPFGEMMSNTAGKNPTVTVNNASVSRLLWRDDGVLEGIQINGSLNPGNSGGPITDAKGRVVAVSVSKLKNTEIGFSTPCNVVQHGLYGHTSHTIFMGTRNQIGTRVTYSFNFIEVAVDPLKKVDKVFMNYWNSVPAEIRPVDPKTKLTTYGAPGDGPKRREEFKWDNEYRDYMLRLTDEVIPAGKNITFQVGYCYASGEEHLDATFVQEIVPGSENRAVTLPERNVLPGGKTVDVAVPEEKKITPPVAARTPRQNPYPPTPTQPNNPTGPTYGRTPPPRPPYNPPSRPAASSPSDAAARATAAAALKPPATVKVDQFISYTPAFSAPTTKKVVYKLKQGVPGMTIDSDTGKVRLSATDSNLGKFKIVIVADIEGAESPVISWTMEITK